MKNQVHATHHIHVRCKGQLYTIGTADIVDIDELYHQLMHIEKDCRNV